MHFIYRTYIPDGRVYLGNVKYMMKMISDYAYTGPIGITVNMLLEHQSQIRTYYYQYGYSGSQSLCDKQVYYGWRYSIKLQLQNLGLGMDFFIYGQSCYSKASRYADFGSRKKPCSLKPCFVRFIPMY